MARKYHPKPCAQQESLKTIPSPLAGSVSSEQDSPIKQVMFLIRSPKKNPLTRRHSFVMCKTTINSAAIDCYYLCEALKNPEYHPFKQPQDELAWTDMSLCAEREVKLLSSTPVSVLFLAAASSSTQLISNRFFLFLTLLLLPCPYSFLSFTCFIFWEQIPLFLSIFFPYPTLSEVHSLSLPIPILFFSILMLIR